jgi:hypothetical protein
MRSRRIALRLRGKTSAAEEENCSLPFPDFESDARKSIKEQSDDDDHNYSSSEKLLTQSSIDSQIDRRIRQLSGLYQPHSESLVRSNNSGSRIKRASELTDDQLVNLVLDGGITDNGNNSERSLDVLQPNNADRQKLERETNIRAAHKKCLDEVNSMYKEHRREQRELAAAYIEQNARHVNRFPWLLADDPIQPDTETEAQVRIDAHGRLVRARRDENNSNATAQASANNNNQDDESREFVDAAALFWRQYRQQQELSQLLPIRLTSSQRNGRQAIQRIETDRQNRAPLNSNQNQQHISQQMERDAREAIDRALDRYRRQDEVSTTANNPSEERAIYELIPIPMVQRENNQVNNDGWFNLPRRRDENNNNNNNNPAGNDDDNIVNRNNHPDLRLTFRRICLAILTVVAAFICTILQDTSLFLDDSGVDVDSVWFTGLLGPHYDGHYANRRRTRRPQRQRLDYGLLREGQGFVTREEMTRIQVLLNEMFDEDDHNDDETCVEEQDGSLPCGKLV